jgi:ATP-dependent phosphofructokinase / diphosphate-dependent phosphofructokinase
MAASSKSAPHGTAVIGQSGGPTVVINQSLVGVIETLRGRSGVDKILGCLHGVSGIVKDQYIELQDIPQERLDRVAQTPSSALGSSRDKPDAEYCKKILHSFARQNVRFFFYIGGNDTSDTCRIVNDLARQAGHDLRCFHVPKTIDNDLLHNDHTPGFASAARFVACALMGDNLDNRALPGVKIDVVMGRHAGFLTAASVMARQSDSDGPHLIYVHEVAFDADRFLGDVDRVYKRHGRCVIAASEGIHDAQATPFITKLAANVERDAHGNVQLSGTGALGDFLGDLIRNKLGIKRVRSDTFGYLQRCFAGCVASVDADEARMAGRKAAELALGGHTDGSVSIQRVSNDPYRVEYKRIDLAAVAGKTRPLDQKYIADGNNIADSFKDYLRPLIGPLPVVETLRGK